MLSKMFSQIKNHTFLSLLLIVTLLSAAGCKSGFLGEQTLTPPTANSQTPSAPPAPLVVDGTRTSYADVVEKTSPAVVRIESEII